MCAWRCLNFSGCPLVTGLADCRLPGLIQLNCFLVHSIRPEIFSKVSHCKCWSIPDTLAYYTSHSFLSQIMPLIIVPSLVWLHCVGGMVTMIPICDPILIWKTILLGTMVNFLFYSLNEAPGSYLSCVKISAWYLQAFQVILLFKLTFIVLCIQFFEWLSVTNGNKSLCWQTIPFLSSIIHRKRVLIVNQVFLALFFN